MATWKKILREDYAVGDTDGLLNLFSTVTTGSSGSIVISLEDQRSSTTEGAGLETITLSAGSGISIGSGGSIGLTNSSFTVAAGANDSPISLGGTLTFAAGGDLTVLENAGTITYSYTAPASASAFGTIAVSGQSNVVADSTNDTLTFVGANGVAITTNATSDTITFTGANNWGAITTGSGTVTPSTSSAALSVSGGTAITTAGSGSTVTINHDNVTNTTGTAGSGTIGTSGGTFTAVTGVTVNAQGHVTNVNTGVLTLSSMIPQVSADNSASDFYLLFQAATGNLNAKIDTATGATAGPRYNPSTATLTVANLTVNGTSTIIETTNLAVDDKTITLAAGATDAAAANGSAIHVGIGQDGLSDTGVNLLPKVKWNNASELSGWTVADYNGGSAVVDKHVSTMQFAPTSTAPTAVDRGDFRYDTTTDILYVCIGN